MARAIAIIDARQGRPISVADVRAALGFSSVYGDADTTNLIDRAVAYCEGESGLLIRRGTYAADFDGFPLHGGSLFVPGLHASVTTFAYWDEEGREQSLAVGTGWRASGHHRGGGLTLWPARPGNRWPAIPLQENAAPSVRITFEAGIDSAPPAAVPGAPAPPAQVLPGDIRTGLLHAIRWMVDENEASHLLLQRVLGSYREYA